jgi:heme-degrading monooxygenase HmoA
MRMNITWGRVKEGMWSEYERLFLQSDATSLGLKGLRCRWLLRDLDDADAGFAISLWDSAEALQQFHSNTIVRDLRENQFKYLFVNEYSRHECEVRVASPGALNHIMPSVPKEERQSQLPSSEQAERDDD